MLRVDLFIYTVISCLDLTFFRQTSYHLSALLLMNMTLCDFCIPQVKLNNVTPQFTEGPVNADFSGVLQVNFLQVFLTSTIMMCTVNIILHTVINYHRHFSIATFVLFFVITHTEMGFC